MIGAILSITQYATHMSDLTPVTENTVPVAKSVSKSARTPLCLSKILRELVALSFWIYVISKLFFFDVDQYLVNLYVPTAAWLLSYKFLLFAATITIVFLFYSKVNGLAFLGYVTFYPVILLVWRIPYFIYMRRSWVLGFSYLSAIFSVVKTVRFNAIISGAYVTAFVLASTVHDRLVLSTCIVAIVLLLGTTYARRLLRALKPNNLFSIWKDALSRIRSQFVTVRMPDDEIKNLPFAQLNSDQIVRWRSKLELNVLYNRTLLLIARKLHEYQHSGMSAISAMFHVFWLVALTVISFALINLAIYKINSNQFVVIGDSSLFLFIYYSFNTMILSSIREMVPILEISQLASMAERLFAFFLISIFVTMMFTVRNQRHSHQLDEVIGDLESEATSFERVIQSIYKIETIEDAIAELEKMKSGMLRIILFLARNLH